MGADDPATPAARDHTPQAAAPATAAPGTAAAGTAAAPAGGSPSLALWRAAGQPQSAAALLAMVGGVRGMVDSAIPGALFVGVYVATRGLTAPLWVASGAALAILVFRLVRREALQPALRGAVGVALAVALAVLTGRPENFFLPTLALNAGYAVAAAISLVLRWPLAGLLLGAVLGEGTGWRRDRARRRAYTTATLLWFGMFAVRVAVLFPLWLAGELVPLGIGRIVLGYPLYALVVWLSWLVIKGARPARARAEAT